MKIIKLYKILLLSIIAIGHSSCDDFLNEEPKSNIAPEQFFENASQLQAYADDMYPNILPGSGGNSYGFYARDAGTDNQVTRSAPSRFDDGQWKVPTNDNDNWHFEKIYRLNFFLKEVMAKYGDDINGSKNTIAGDLASIKHYIGEVYFLRAQDYFNRYQKFGDFPIIPEPLADDKEVLTDASKRMPRNEVARFILTDLDNAIALLGAKDMATTRINKDAALLLKSRVALFEGTWLKYFKNTPFVPNGPGWLGKEKDYNANYQFQGGSIDSEINFFLEQAMSASKEVADKYKDKLASNNDSLQQSVSDPANAYYDMFSSDNLSGVSEVLLWRQYVRGLIGNDVALAANSGNWSVGVTRSYVQNFLMADGTPVYAHGTYTDGDGYYKGDKTIEDVHENRDTRLQLFIKKPGQTNILTESVTGLGLYYEEPYPNITTGDPQRGYSTGYALRKGGAFDTKYYIQNEGIVGLVVYRAAEALLNYMEAGYEKEGSLNSTALEYWQVLRRRANVSDDISKTIAATDMAKEAENDWAAYSGGTLLSDATLYNIRRERRCEFLSEGIRYMDLCRWRAMDQLKVTPYIPEGMHLWNTEMEDWYIDEKTGETMLVYGGNSANVSPPTNSEYLRPLQRLTNQRCYDGFIWHEAHYLHPVPYKQFLLTSSDGKSVEQSTLFQNPYWPLTADAPAEK